MAEQKITKVKYNEIANKYPNTIIIPITNVGLENFEIK